MPQPPKKDALSLSRADARKAQKIATGPLMGPVPEPTPTPTQQEPAKAAPLGSFLDVQARIREAIGASEQA